MTIIGEFEFTSSWLELTRQGNDTLLVIVDRELRIKPFIGMKQPTPAGAFMGYEAYLIIHHFGKPAKHFPWILYAKRGDILEEIQHGNTDENGRSGDLNIDLVDDQLYVLTILEPIESPPKIEQF